MTKPKIVLVSIFVRLLAVTMIFGIFDQLFSEGVQSLIREFSSGWIGFVLLYVPVGIFLVFCLLAPASKLHLMLSNRAGIILFITGIGSSVANDIWVLFNHSVNNLLLVVVLLQILCLGMLVRVHFSLRSHRENIEKGVLKDQWNSYWKIKKWEKRHAEDNPFIYSLKFILLGAVKLICIDFYGIRCPVCQKPYFKKSKLALNPTPIGCEHCGLDSKTWTESPTSNKA